MILERMKRWMIQEETDWAVNEENINHSFHEYEFPLVSMLRSMMVPGIICVSHGNILMVNSNCIKTVNLKASIWVFKWDIQSDLEAI